MHPAKKRRCRLRNKEETKGKVQKKQNEKSEDEKKSKKMCSSEGKYSSEEHFGRKCQSKLFHYYEDRSKKLNACNLCIFRMVYL
jgi:hypothetical protein